MKTVRFPLILLMILSLTTGCEKQKDYAASFSASIVEVTTTSVKINTSISASIEIEAQGLLYSVENDIRLNQYYYNYYTDEFNEEGKIVDSDLLANREYTLTNLKPSTQYYFKLYTVINGIEKYSDLYTFQTECGGLGCGPAGGIIIWSDGAGGGIEVARSYITPTAIWGCDGTSVATSDDIGTGQANTTQIIADCEPNTLAAKCEAYVQDGYDDYYMPSIEELKLIYSEVYINAGNPYIYGATTYYSSSESYNYACKGLSFSSNSVGDYVKYGTYYSTIPVRTF